MRSQNSLYRRTLKRTAMAVALGASLTSSIAFAQSNSAGVIFGDTATPGAVVHVENVNTGQTRDITVDADGRYRATALPVGIYKVTLQQDGQAVQTRDNVQVRIGTGTNVSFTAASAGNAQSLESIQVVASALPAIDVSSVDSRTTLTADQLQKLPVARNVNAAIMLAPGAVQGDSRYGNVVSLGGSSAAENQYYINGYAVTNPLTGIGFTTLPFDAIDQEQVFYGGYGAEYGRSTGGVVNIITKRGGNTWKAGAEMLWTPRVLRDSPRDIYQKDGQLAADRSNNKSWQTQYGAYVSGPLIKDKLFMYATGEFTKSEGSSVSGVTAGSQKSYDENKATRWLAKVDWNITDNHIVELTAIGDQSELNETNYDYNYLTGAQGDVLSYVRQKNSDSLAGANPGGNIYIGKYTGYITDNLTISALYGKSKTDHINSSTSPSGQPCPIVQDFRDSVPVSQRLGGCWGVGVVSIPGTSDETEGWRFDVEYLLGDHDLRVGVDNQTLKSYAGQEYEGGSYWQYLDRPASGVVRGGVPLPAGYDYVGLQQIISTAANVKVKQQAQYIEDHWQISDRWLAYIGLRNEQFSNYNGDGVAYAKQRHQLAPRLGVTWDVFGDSTFKVYANAGRYHLAIPSNVAVRAASGSLFTSQYCVFDGAVNDYTQDPVNCIPVEQPVVSNGEDGTAPDPRSVAARGLKAYYQDEYILGFDKAFGNDWTFGAKATYRNLKSSIDDFCDYRPFDQWSKDNGLGGLTDDQKDGWGCLLFNPGQSNRFAIDLNGDGQYEDINLSKEALGFPDLKRSYYALNLYLEHQFSNQWYGRVDYTFSRSYGNTEGMLKSDIGQTDPSVTQDWDYPEFMIGANGPQANDHTHALRMMGYYQMTPEWLFSANLAVTSGRPKSCIGTYPGIGDMPPAASNYGAAFFYCDGKLSPRGSKGRTPWTQRLDLGVEYRPNWADQNLAFSANVFNVFTQQREVSVVEVGEDGAGNPSARYLRPISFTTPRYVQLGVRYDFSM